MCKQLFYLRSNTLARFQFIPLYPKSPKTMRIYSGYRSDEKNKKRKKKKRSPMISFIMSLLSSAKFYFFKSLRKEKKKHAAKINTRSLGTALSSWQCISRTLHTAYELHDY